MQIPPAFFRSTSFNFKSTGALTKRFIQEKFFRSMNDVSKLYKGYDSNSTVLDSPQFLLITDILSEYAT